jgi:hypothetical protein
MHEEQTYVKLHVVNMTVKTTSCSLKEKDHQSKLRQQKRRNPYRNFGVWVPFLKCFEFYKAKDKYLQHERSQEMLRTPEAQEFPEFVHSTSAPLSGLLDSHDFDKPQDRWSSTPTESSGRTRGSRLQDIG